MYATLTKKAFTLKTRYNRYMSKIQVSVVVVHYGDEKNTLKLIKNLDNIEDLIIVDNSQDRSLKDSLKNFTNCRLIVNQINTGFAHACNQGFLVSKNDFVLFLNSDLDINELQIKQLLIELKEKNLTAVAPTFLNDKGQLDFNYRKEIPNFFSLITEFSWLNKIIKNKNPQKITLPGACLLVNKTKFLTLGLWDERFFLWFEDSDVSKKLLNDEHNFGISKAITIKHQGGSSFKPLSMSWKKQVFFHSLNIYADKYFSGCKKLIVKKLTSRFANNKLYPKNSKIRASIIVPNLRKDLLKNFLILNNKFFDYSQDELIIVTSASNIYNLRQDYPQVIFIQIEKNKGFVKTVNIGLKRATGDLLGTVNDDVILSNGWLENLIKEAKNYQKNQQIKLGTISPLIKNSKGEIESLGVIVLPIGKAIPNHQLAEFTISNSFNAAVVLFNRFALEEVGLFDEKFGSYLEDIDLGLRFDKKGYKNLAIKSVEVIHLGQQTSSKKPIYKAWLDLKNWCLVIAKNWSISQKIKYAPGIFLERLKNLSGLLKAIF